MNQATPECADASNVGYEWMRESGLSDGTDIESRYSALVARLERKALAAPASYKRRVFLLATLGYAYPVAVLTGLLATMVSAVYVVAWAPLAVIAVGLKFGAKLFAIPLLVLSFAILRSFWVRLAPPEGRRIVRNEAPRLFELCDVLRTRLRGPRIHRILVTDEFNAGIVQIPRLGLLGWPRSYLVVGLPLALALSPKQFEAVLAHEYGHLAGAHGHFSAWVYRMRQTWERLAMALGERSSWGAFLFAPFFNWYAPYFNAYSFVLARANEYEADRCSADVVGPRIAADALIEVSVRERALGRYFWTALWKHANQQLEPPYLPYRHMGTFLKRPLDPEFVQRSLRSILAQTTDNEDTHPSPADRIKALGQEPQLPLDLEVSAAEHLFDQSLDDLVGEFDSEWRKEILPQWQERFQQALNWRYELAGLGAKAERGPLDAEECWQRATLTEELKDTAAALPLYRSLLQAHPKHAGANFAVGRIMLDEGDAQGLDPLEAAMKLDPDSIIDACEVAHQHLTETGRKAEAKSYRDRARQRYELGQRAGAERSVHTPTDTLLPHGLEPAVLATLVAQLRGVPALHRAYLTRKKLEFMTEHPWYVLAVETRRRFRSSTDAGEITEVLAFNLEFPKDFVVVSLTSLAGRNQADMRRIDGALIYEHPGSDSAPAEEGPWRMYVTAGMEAYQRGDHAEAEKQFEVALGKAEHFGPWDTHLAQSLDNLSWLYHTQGRYAEAEPLCKRELEIREKTLGPRQPDVAGSLLKLAMLYHDQDRYNEAATLSKRALAIMEGTLGPDHPDVAGGLMTLGAAYRRGARYAEAEPLLQRALTINKKALGPDHPRTAASLSQLARLYRVQGKHSDAECLFNRVLTIAKKALGPDHPNVGVTLFNLARVHRAQGNPTEAEPLFKRALDIQENALVPDHPDVAETLENYASVLRETGRGARADVVEARAKAIRARQRCGRHPQPAASDDHR